MEYPVYWTMREFCEGFKRLLDHLQLDKVSTCNVLLKYEIRRVQRYSQLFVSQSRRSPQSIENIDYLFQSKFFGPRKFNLRYQLFEIPYKFYVLGQIGLSKQCRPRSDCF